MFTWDPQKAITNYEKHHVSFEEAATVFADHDGLDWEDPRHSDTESRRKRLDLSLDDRVLLIVYTLRSLKNGKETIRIISARQSNKKERQAYFG